MLNTTTTTNSVGAAPAQGHTGPPVATSKTDATSATGKTEETSAATAPSEQGAQSPSNLQLNRAVEALQRKAEAVNASLRFRIDDGTGKTVVTVINTEDGSVIRQIPSEEALALSQAISEQQGLLINTRA